MSFENKTLLIEEIIIYKNSLHLREEFRFPNSSGSVVASNSLPPSIILKNENLHIEGLLMIQGSNLISKISRGIIEDSLIYAAVQIDSFDIESRIAKMLFNGMTFEVYVTKTFNYHSSHYCPPGIRIIEKLNPALEDISYKCMI